jgi:hypothetical protein
MEATVRTGRPTTPVTLTTDERQALDSLAHRSRSAPHVAHRARILAYADRGATTRIGKRLHISKTTICTWRTHSLQDRVDGLFDEPRSGAPRRITDAPNLRDGSPQYNQRT